MNLLSLQMAVGLLQILLMVLVEIQPETYLKKEYCKINNHEIRLSQSQLLQNIYSDLEKRKNQKIDNYTKNKK